MKLRGIISSVFMLALLVGVFSATASASSLFVGEEDGNAVVPRGEVVDGSAYLAGNVVTVQGRIKGDVYCAGNTVRVEGVVDGDVLCAGNTVAIGGIVRGDVRLAGSSVSVDGIVAGNATVGGSDVVVSSGSRIGGDLTGGASSLTIDGKVGRDMTVGSSSLVVNGTIGRDINAGVQDVTFGNGAEVGGSFVYTSDKEAIVPGGVVSGEVSFSKQENRATEASAAAVAWGIGVTISIAVLALLGAVFMPKQIHAVASVSWARFAVALTLGFAFVILAPILAILLLVTGFGAVTAYAVVLAWLLLMALSPVFVAYFVGEKVYGKNSRNIVLRSLVGALILLVALLVPVINSIAFMVMLFSGVGLVLSRIPHLYQGKAYEAPAAAKTRKVQKA